MPSTIQAEPAGAVGRPTTYSTEIVATILARMADGESLRSICQDDGMPCKVTFFRWLMRHAELKEAYAEAREMQADSLFEEVLEVGRADPGIIITSSKTMSKSQVDSGEVQHRKLKIDTLKWAAGKLRPKKYGDTTQVQAEVAHRYVAHIPQRTTNDPAEWAKRVQAERVASGELVLPAPPDPTPATVDVEAVVVPIVPSVPSGVDPAPIAPPPTLPQRNGNVRH